MTSRLSFPQFNVNTASRLFFSRVLSATSPPGYFDLRSSVTDSVGNVYISISCDPGATFQVLRTGSSSIKTLSGSQGYLLKFNSAGVIQWAIAIYASPLGNVWCCIDPVSSAVYVCGWANDFLSFVNIDTGAYLGGFGGSNGTYGFLAKFSSAGAFLFGRNLNGTGSSYGGIPSCDTSGNVYMCGGYSSTGTKIVDQAGTSLGTLANPTGKAGYFVKFNSSGTFQFARTIDGSTDENVWMVFPDAVLSIYMCGFYSGTATLRNQAGTSLGTLPASTGMAGFFTKFNSAGTLQYSRVVDSAGDDECYFVTCDSTSNVYLGGYYNSTPTIKAVSSGSVSTNIGTLPASSSGTAGFFTKFDSGGTLQYSRVFDGTNNTLQFGACEATSNIYVCGVIRANTTIKAVTSASVSSNIGTLTVGTGDTGFCSKFGVSAGDLQFSRTIDGGTILYGASVDTGSSSFYVTGLTSGSATIKDQSGTTLGTLPSGSGLLTKFLALT